MIVAGRKVNTPERRTKWTRRYGIIWLIRTEGQAKEGESVCTFNQIWSGLLLRCLDMCAVARTTRVSGCKIHSFRSLMRVTKRDRLVTRPDNFNQLRGLLTRRQRQVPGSNREGAREFVTATEESYDRQ